MLVAQLSAPKSPKPAADIELLLGADLQQSGRSAAVLAAVRDEPYAEGAAGVAPLQLTGAMVAQPIAESPPVTPGCSPMEQEMAAAAASSGAEDFAIRRRQPSHMYRQMSGEWQLVDEGDRIACVLVTGASRPQPRRSDNHHPVSGKAEFGLEVQAEWHSQLESLIEMGFPTQMSLDALRMCDGDLMRSFKYLGRASAGY